MYKKSISLFNVRTGVVRPVVNSNTLDVTTPNSDLNIAASQTGGNIKIGNAKTSGSIYLGNTGNTGNTVVINAPLITSEITAEGNLNLGPTSLIHLNSSSGTANQYLASQGTSTPMWKDIPAPTWVGTATSDLNMNGYDITCDTIHSNSLDTTTDLNIAASQLSGNIKIGNAKSSGSIYL